MSINYLHPDPVAFALLLRLCAACDSIERPLSNIAPTTVSGEETRADLAWANALARELVAVLKRLEEREEPRYLDSGYADLIGEQPQLGDPPGSSERQAAQAIRAAAGRLLL